MAEANQLIGLDLGQRRTGVARASTVARLPEPLLTIETDKLLEYLKQLSADSGLAAIVIGLPRNLAGADTPQTAWVRSWVKEAKLKLTVPFYWQDEALTSREARSADDGRRGQVDEDAAAAAIILRDFLDTPSELRVSC